MARVKRVKEKLHLPIYDAFFVPGGRTGTQAATFEDMMTDPGVIRFFVDVRNKTRLETNLQAAGVLPRRTTFEARAMRVVISRLVEEQPFTSPPQVNEPSFLAALTWPSSPSPAASPASSMRCCGMAACSSPSAFGSLVVPLLLRSPLRGCDCVNDALTMRARVSRRFDGWVSANVALAAVAGPLRRCRPHPSNPLLRPRAQ